MPVKETCTAFEIALIDEHHLKNSIVSQNLSNFSGSLKIKIKNRSEQ